MDKNSKWNKRIEESEQNMLKLESDTYKVIGVDREKSKHTRSKYYYIQCKKCGSIFSRVYSAVKYGLNAMQCTNCRKNRFGKPLNVLEYKMYCFYRSSAHQRNKKFYLTERQFKNLIKQNCYYCGESPSRNQSVTYRNDYELVNGIDRIDSDKDYSIDNVVPCCSMCNKMKNTYSKEEFFNKVTQIYQHSIKGSTTIPQGSTSQANGDGNGEHPTKDEDIV